MSKESGGDQAVMVVPGIWKRIQNEWDTQPTSFFAAIITIIISVGNLIASFPILFSNSTTTGLLWGEWNLVVRLITFVLLESSLAYAFGVAFVRLSEAGRGMPYMFMIVATIISAWISCYNALWLFASHFESYSEAEWPYIGAVVVAYAIAWYFIYHHYDAKEQQAKELSAKMPLSSTAVKMKVTSDTYEKGMIVAIVTQTVMFIFLGFYVASKIESTIEAVSTS